MAQTGSSAPTLRECIKDLTCAQDRPAEDDAGRHCVFQDEFLLQFVPSNVSPPIADGEVSSPTGYVLASSYVSTDGGEGGGVARHQVACLRPPTSFVLCCSGSSSSSAGGSEERPAMVTELRHALHKGECVFISRDLNMDALTSLTADDGRYLMSLYSANPASADENLLPLWVMCNPAKPTQLVWLAGGMQREVSEDGVKLDHSAGAGPSSQSLLSCRYLGSILRPSSLLDSPTAFYPLPSLRSLLSHGCAPLDVDGGLAFSDQAGMFSADYEIIGAFNLLTSDGTASESLMADDMEFSGSGSLLAVRYRWTNGATVLSYPPATASAVVLVRAVSNDLRSPAARLLRELNQLEAWLEVLEMDDEAGRVQWRQGETSSDTAFERAAAFAREIQTRTAEDLMQWRPDEGRLADLDAISSHMLPVRQDLDFTQLFWLLAKDAVGVKDASRCLLHVSRSLLKQDIQPMVYRENSTALADLVRQCLQCTSQEQLVQVSSKLLSSTGSNLIRALAVILQTGFHKLERDFVHFFLSEELATWNQLAPFLITSFPPAEQAVGEARAWYRLQLGRLRALHCCLELVMMCRAYLSLPAECLRQLLRSALAYYAKNEGKGHPTFCLPLPKKVKDCLEICMRNLPSSWSCTVHDAGVSTTLRLSVNPPYTSLEAEEVQSPDGKALTRFHVTQTVSLVN